MANLRHKKWEKSGRTFEVLDGLGQPIPGKIAYQSVLEQQKNVDLGAGVFVPYVWDGPSQSIRYANLQCEFDIDGFATIREYGR